MKLNMTALRLFKRKKRKPKKRALINVAREKEQTRIREEYSKMKSYFVRMG